MVARINASASLSRVLSYNEKKVAQNNAALLDAKHFLQDKQRMTFAQKFQRFQRLNDLNPRSQVNTLHISLNFNPADQISDKAMTAIAGEYMKGIGLQEQPYLVYRHQDAGHPHCHIVTTLIQPDGRRVRTQNIGKDLSEPIRQSIEKNFGLIPAKAKRQTQKPQKSGEQLQEIQYGPDTPLKESVDRELQKVLRDYHFTTLPEYNAILRACNLMADTGGPNSQTRQHGGLHYRVLDDKGRKLGVPLKASQLSGNPTLAQLEKIFEKNQAHRIHDLPALRHRVDWALHQNTGFLRDLVQDLQQEGIDLVLDRQASKQQPHLIYVDHAGKTAISGDDLGPSYTAQVLLQTPSPGQRPSLTKENTQTLHPAVKGFSTRVPQALATLMQHDPSFGSHPKQSPDDHQPHQRPKH